jgi:hypothetical protein
MAGTKEPVSPGRFAVSCRDVNSGRASFFLTVIHHKPQSIDQNVPDISEFVELCGEAEGVRHGGHHFEDK